MAKKGSISFAFGKLKKIKMHRKKQSVAPHSGKDPWKKSDDSDAYRVYLQKRIH